MNELTLKDLKEMQLGIFASGTIENDPEGISSQTLSWVAVRDAIHDWCIYSAYEDVDFEWIKYHGDKVYDEDMIKKFVPCDDEAFKMYRY